MYQNLQDLTISIFYVKGITFKGLNACKLGLTERISAVGKEPSSVLKKEIGPFNGLHQTYPICMFHRLLNETWNERQEITASWSIPSLFHMAAPFARDLSRNLENDRQLEVQTLISGHFTPSLSASSLLGEWKLWNIVMILPFVEFASQWSLWLIRTCDLTSYAVNLPAF